MDKFSLQVEKGIHGLWYVTSPDAKGFMSAGATLSEALGKVEAALHELRDARLAAAEPGYTQYTGYRP